jgi:hypothetical protein
MANRGLLPDDLTQQGDPVASPDAPAAPAPTAPAAPPSPYNPISTDRNSYPYTPPTEGAGPSETDLANAAAGDTGQRPQYPLLPNDVFQNPAEPAPLETGTTPAAPAPTGSRYGMAYGGTTAPYGGVSPYQYAGVAPWFMPGWQPGMGGANPYAPRTAGNLPSPYDSGPYSWMPQQYVLPNFLQNTQANLPPPNQIRANQWIRLDPNTQSLFRAAYEAQGYDPNYIDWTVRNLLPGRVGVPTGFSARIRR